jgi:O-antigen/teichoic acid export membrane protein
LLDAVSIVPQSILKRDMRMRDLAACGAIANLTAGSAAIALAITGFGIWSLVFQQLLFSVINTAALWYRSAWRPTGGATWQSTQPLLKYAAHASAFRLTEFVAAYSDRLVVGHLFGPLAVGYYNMATRIHQISNDLLAGGVIALVALPSFARMQTDPEKLRTGFLNGSLYACALSFPGFVGFVIVSPELVPLALGDQWLPTVPLVQIISIQGLVASWIWMQRSLLRGIGKIRWVIWLTCLEAGLTIIALAIGAMWGSPS